ncbi:MAG: thiamine pyrophosphate-dependent enzyme, partial [Planctomycetota bacterium]|nr:thiamine pyrophosphate-dependent enzyme [Planctomycetota bacterium]
SRTVRAHVAVAGDVRESLKRLLRLLKPRDRKPWLDAIAGWKKSHPLKMPNNGLHAQYVIRRISEISRGRAIVATDVGQHQMWTAQFYVFNEPRHFLTSGGLGTMGYGLPAAIGAAVARPGEDVWCITGDGSIMMNVQEMVTARRLNLPIKVAVMNNGYLGMVRQWQEMFWGGRYSETRLSDTPDLVRVAEAFGWRGIRVEEKEKVDGAIAEAYKSKDSPVLLDFRVRGEDNVYPMVPAGRTINEMIYYPKDPELV